MPRRGTVLVVAETALGEALAASPMGPLPLVDALRPALDALAASLRRPRRSPTSASCRPTSRSTSCAARPQHALVPLTGDGRSAGLGGDVAQPCGCPCPPPAAAARASGRGLEMLHDVVMELTAELGRTRMTVRDLLALAAGQRSWSWTAWPAAPPTCW